MADSQQRPDCKAESLQALLRQDAALDEPGMDAAEILRITRGKPYFFLIVRKSFVNSPFISFPPLHRKA